MRIYATGKRGAAVEIEIVIVKHSIMASCESAHITEAQMRKAVKRQFPKHTFYNVSSKYDGYMRLDADRWTDDGLQEVR